MSELARYLITTADERTWKFDRPVLFLGEWCRLYARKECWSEMNAEVLAYHWDDFDKYYADYQYLREFYERALAHLAAQLNEIHGVDHGMRYWRILTGPWLADFIQVLFDRWSCIRQAVTHFEITGTTVLTGRDDALVPNDMSDFGQLVVGDEWNHHVYATALEHFNKVPCIEWDHDVQPAVSKMNTVGVKHKVGRKHKIAASFAKVASLFVREHDAFLINTYLPLLSELRLQLRFNQIPQWWRRIQPVRVPIDWQQRKWSITAHCQSDFEEYVLAMIPKQIPILYLEGYRQLVEQTRKLPWPKNPKVIFTSSELWHGTVSTAYTAEKVERGTPLVYGQHGGSYGLAKFTWLEEHETSIADRYLTWGWSDPLQPKIVPVGILKPIPRLGRKSAARTTLLLVLYADSQYSYRLTCSQPISSLWLHYCRDSFSFVSNLPKILQNQLLVRLYKHDSDWRQYSRWQSRFPEIKLDSGGSRMRDLLKGTRLAVYTYNSTGFLEAFAGDLPSIIYWDSESSPLRESAAPYFEDLKRAGIFHETPESAARHVDAIWDDVDAWWNSSGVRKALESFKGRYCDLPDNLLGRIEHCIRQVMATSR